MKRKIIQIAAAQSESEGRIECSVYALCDDHSVCFYDFDEHCWYEVESIDCCKTLKAKHLTAAGKKVTIKEYQ